MLFFRGKAILDSLLIIIGESRYDIFQTGLPFIVHVIKERQDEHRLTSTTTSSRLIMHPTCPSE